MHVLFLGAGKRLSLLESFARAAEAEALPLRMWSIEGKSQVPIGVLAGTIIGPRFNDPDFGSFLTDVVESHRIDLVIPNMDTATVALATQVEALTALGCSPIVSSLELCEAMLDKQKAADWFARHHVPQPAPDTYPMIIKSRFGYGARDQAIVGNSEGRSSFFIDKSPDNYFSQAFIKGPEYTVDAYVDKAGHLVSALSRKRLEVVGGEVSVSETCRHEQILEQTARILSQPGWLGPVTLQFIDGPNEPVILEINPRFGGGVTHSIHCGLDMPRWLMRERLGRPLPSSPTWNSGSVMTRCLRDIFYDHRS
ncbi:ATP-grasp domain-containing protein (plasmid) [Azospirillum melinis]|uniref:ATP-grasp domain-containing protein n=1 Tax=Azospirillum melinis TaxID=328839 RepID=UPI003757490F